MNAKEIDFLSSREVVGFTLPVMHTTGGNWYVDFYAHDPVSGRMRRKKYMLNKYKTERNKRVMGSLIIHNLTAKLTAGWNPWVMSISLGNSLKYRLSSVDIAIIFSL